ncbi:MAG: hypothetical protein AAGJ40_01155 [Planctomycetota bacterium]
MISPSAADLVMSASLVDEPVIETPLADEPMNATPPPSERVVRQPVHEDTSPESAGELPTRATLEDGPPDRESLQSEVPESQVPESQVPESQVSESQVSEGEVAASEATEVGVVEGTDQTDEFSVKENPDFATSERGSNATQAGTVEVPESESFDARVTATARTAAALGSVGIALSLTTVFSSVYQVMMLVLGKNASWTVTIVLALSTTGASVWFVYPQLTRYLGVRARTRIGLQYRRKYRLRHIEGHLRNLRIFIGFACLVPLIAYWSHSVIRVFDPSWMPEPAVAVPLVGAVILLVAVGLTIQHAGPTVYSRMRAREIKRGLSHYYRGVSLRSVIPQWDSPKRPIYRTCRMSRRLANAHRAIFVIAAACFSLAGCLSALVRTDVYVAEVGVLIALALIVSLWPTTHRLVRYSARVIDPYCRSKDEYEEFG